MDDPDVSPRLAAFLAERGRLTGRMSEDEIRSSARATRDDVRQVAAPPELVAAMVGFEERYGGLTYELLTGNPMEYGLDGEATGYWTEHGWAFAGIPTATGRGRSTCWSTAAPR